MTKSGYIAHLIGLGIPKFVAKRVAKLHDGQEFSEEPDAATAILCFATWSETPEGHHFWDALHKVFQKP